MGVCSVIGCKSRSRERRMPHRAVEGITFHSFPSKNLDLRARWCMAVRGPGWAPSKFSKVCSKHFEERCFDRSGQTCRLRENAMPTQELDQTRLAMALTNTKMEVVEAPGVDSLTENGMQLQDTPSFANVVAQAVLNVQAGAFHCPGPCHHHTEGSVLSPDECNKLMYALDLGDGRKIKLVYSVPRGQCVGLF
ncbi:uncharacterized protein LOC117642227 isoform X4 [Thrips palmi]|uniref:Uncharacterized protein LOC117642227 isoform X4 n=1 Tax=Thrips palmi TaxID=161013 RepID=A0A6P8Y8U6_THRPL|nr:uncharacterized protein LOC117642227 isoform X4 [Thrips palmi]